MYPADRRWLFSANLSAQKLAEPVLTVADFSLQLGAPALETGPSVHSFCAVIFPAPRPEQQPGLTGGPIADVALHGKWWRPDLRCFLKALKPRVMAHCCSLLTEFPRQSKTPYQRDSVRCLYEWLGTVRGAKAQFLCLDLGWPRRPSSALQPPWDHRNLKAIVLLPSFPSAQPCFH